MSKRRGGVGKPQNASAKKTKKRLEAKRLLLASRKKPWEKGYIKPSA